MEIIGLDNSGNYDDNFPSYYNHPLDQFEILNLAFYWEGNLLPTNYVALTNFTIFLILNTTLIRVLYGCIVNRTALLSSGQYFLKQIHNLVKSIFKSNTTLKRSQYFSVLLYLFIFILIANVVGLIPYSYTVTSSFVVTFFLALMHFNGINIIGIFQTKWKTWGLILPSGVPLLIVPFLTLIELISYVAKVFSLSIRLFANMMAGHALLKILIGFSFILFCMGIYYLIIALLPWITVTAIFFLEALIAFLQAYVFVILVTIYINDVLNWH